MNIVVTHPNMLSPKVGQNEPIISIEDLDTVDPASVMSISAFDCLDYVVQEQRTKVLALLNSKIRQDGTLDIHGCDIFAAASAMYNGRISLDTANEVMFQNRRSMDTLDRTVTSLRSLELEIVSCKIEGFIYYIKARRPTSAE